VFLSFLSLYFGSRRSFCQPVFRFPFLLGTFEIGKRLTEEEPQNHKIAKTQRKTILRFCGSYCGKNRKAKT